MIGSGLKKLAAEYGLKVDHGVAYGVLHGYAATMCEGSGWKRIVFAARFADSAQKTAFMDAVQAVDVKNIYRVLRLGINATGVQVDFYDTVGTMEKIREFIPWFTQLLQEYQAFEWDNCPECGNQITEGKWLLTGGVCAQYYHADCAQKVVREVEERNEQRKNADGGSYLKGTAGALLGALLGSAVWAAVLMMGYVASVVGLVIGWLADRGYRLLHGRNGKGKLAILIVAVVLGVLVGTIAAETVGLARYIGQLKETTLTFSNIPKLMVSLLVHDAEYRSAVLGNMGMGLLFAALGAGWLVFRTGKGVSGDKAIELK